MTAPLSYTPPPPPPPPPPPSGAGLTGAQIAQTNTIANQTAAANAIANARNPDPNPNYIAVQKILASAPGGGQTISGGTVGGGQVIAGGVTPPPLQSTPTPVTIKPITQGTIYSSVAPNTPLPIVFTGYDGQSLTQLNALAKANPYLTIGQIENELPNLQSEFALAQTYGAQGAAGLLQSQNTPAISETQFGTNSGLFLTGGGVNAKELNLQTGLFSFQENIGGKAYTFTGNIYGQGSIYASQGSLAGNPTAEVNAATSLAWAQYITTLPSVNGFSGGGVTSAGTLYNYNSFNINVNTGAVTPYAPTAVASTPLVQFQLINYLEANPTSVGKQVVVGGQTFSAQQTTQEQQALQNQFQVNVGGTEYTFGTFGQVYNSLSSTGQFNFNNGGLYNFSLGQKTSAPKGSTVYTASEVELLAGSPVTVTESLNPGFIVGAGQSVNVGNGVTATNPYIFPLPLEYVPATETIGVGGLQFKTIGSTTVFNPNPTTSKLTVGVDLFPNAKQTPTPTNLELLPFNTQSQPSITTVLDSLIPQNARGTVTEFVNVNEEAYAAFKTTPLAIDIGAQIQAARTTGAGVRSYLANTFAITGTGIYNLGQQPGASSFQRSIDNFLAAPYTYAANPLNPSSVNPSVGTPAGQLGIEATEVSATALTLGAGLLFEGGETGYAAYTARIAYAGGSTDLYTGVQDLLGNTQSPSQIGSTFFLSGITAGIYGKAVEAQLVAKGFANPASEEIFAGTVIQGAKGSLVFASYGAVAGAAGNYLTGGNLLEGAYSGAIQSGAEGFEVGGIFGKGFEYIGKVPLVGRLLANPISGSISFGGISAGYTLLTGGSPSQAITQGIENSLASFAAYTTGIILAPGEDESQAYFNNKNTKQTSQSNVEINAAPQGSLKGASYQSAANNEAIFVNQVGFADVLKTSGKIDIVPHPSDINGNYAINSYLIGVRGTQISSGRGEDFTPVQKYAFDYKTNPINSLQLNRGLETISSNQDINGGANLVAGTSAKAFQESPINNNDMDYFVSGYKSIGNVISASREPVVVNSEGFYLGRSNYDADTTINNNDMDYFVSGYKAKSSFLSSSPIEGTINNNNLPITSGDKIFQESPINNNDLGYFVSGYEARSSFLSSSPIEGTINNNDLDYFVSGYKSGKILTPITSGDKIFQESPINNNDMDYFVSGYKSIGNVISASREPVVVNSEGFYLGRSNYDADTTINNNDMDYFVSGYKAKSSFLSSSPIEGTINNNDLEYFISGYRLGKINEPTKAAEKILTVAGRQSTFNRLPIEQTNGSTFLEQPNLPETQSTQATSLYSNPLEISIGTGTINGINTRTFTPAEIERANKIAEFGRQNARSQKGYVVSVHPISNVESATDIYRGLATDIVNSNKTLGILGQEKINTLQNLINSTEGTTNAYERVTTEKTYTPESVKAQMQYTQTYRPKGIGLKSTLERLSILNGVVQGERPLSDILNGKITNTRYRQITSSIYKAEVQQASNGKVVAQAKANTFFTTEAIYAPNPNVIDYLLGNTAIYEPIHEIGQEGEKIPVRVVKSARFTTTGQSGINYMLGKAIKLGAADEGTLVNLFPNKGKNVTIPSFEARVDDAITAISQGKPLRYKVTGTNKEVTVEKFKGVGTGTFNINPTGETNVIVNIFSSNANNADFGKALLEVPPKSVFAFEKGNNPILSVEDNIRLGIEQTFRVDAGREEVSARLRASGYGYFEAPETDASQIILESKQATQHNGMDDVADEIGSPPPNQEGGGTGGISVARLQYKAARSQTTEQQANTIAAQIAVPNLNVQAPASPTQEDPIVTFRAAVLTSAGSALTITPETLPFVTSIQAGIYQFEGTGFSPLQSLEEARIGTENSFATSELTSEITNTKSLTENTIAQVNLDVTLASILETTLLSDNLLINSRVAQVNSEILENSFETNIAFEEITRTSNKQIEEEIQEEIELEQEETLQIVPTVTVPPLPPITNPHFNQNQNYGEELKKVVQSSQNSAPLSYTPSESAIALPALEPVFERNFNIETIGIGVRPLVEPESVKRVISQYNKNRKQRQ